MALTSYIRRFGSVTSKIQRRRDNYVRAKYPEYKGNAPESVSDEPSLRRGRRLGGSFEDPSRPVLKLDGSEDYYDSESQRDIDEAFMTRLNQSRNDPSKMTEILSNYHEALESYTSNKEPISAERNRVIKSMSTMDYQVLSGGRRQSNENLLLDSHHRRILEKNKFTTASLSVHSTPPRNPPPLAENTFPILREEEDMFPPILPLLNQSVMTRAFQEHSITLVDVNGTSVPSVVSSSLEEYNAAKSSSTIFDVSYKRLISIRGSDSILAMDHFLSAPIHLLHIGDAMEACVLDTKGYVMSTCLVSRLSDDSYSIILDGTNTDAVFRYMAQYIVYSRQSGLDVHLRLQPSGGVFMLYGPCGTEKILTSPIAGDEKFFLGNSVEIPRTDYIAKIPPMSTVSSSVCQITRLPNDRFLITLLGEEGKEFIQSLGPFGGSYALDILRMESGDIRPGSDIPPSTTPIAASLRHLVDQRKVREKILFGHERIAKELLKEPPHKRVGLVASKYIYAGCRILSAPHRAPIGEITSCAWSPVLKKRVCQAYIKPEFAIEHNPVLINIPHEIPESIEYRFRRRIVKQGNLQSVFRRLIPATVVGFPISS